MALNPSALAAEMRSDLLSDPVIGAVDDAALTAFCEKLAGVMLAHIVANAVVNVTVATTGTAAAQAGTGTGTVT